MKMLSVCRICLSTETAKDVSYKSQQCGKTYSEMMLFCLNVRVVNDTEICNKLCLKCLKKVTTFYNFKLLALKNDAYLKSLDSNRSQIKTESLIPENLKQNGSFVCDSICEKSDCDKIKLEPFYHEEGLGCDTSGSEDELLSEVKRIKYEFIPEDNETTENENVKKRKTDKTEKQSSHVCKECGKSVKNLKHHIKLHTPKGTTIPCTLCEKIFSSHNAKSKHVRKIHLAVRKPCPICNKEVKNLKHHMLRLHNTSALRYECATCGKRFMTANVRNAHMLTHTKDRPHSCDKCDKRFRQYVNLVQHKRQIHDKNETHLCQYCSKRFFTVKYLQRHLRCHSTERAFQCKQCDKAFKTAKELRNHTYTHSEDRAFHCTICDMSFVHPGYLRAHTLTHTREKQFPCKYCDVKFHRSDHRKRHEFTAHEKHLISNR